MNRHIPDNRDRFRVYFSKKENEQVSSLQVFAASVPTGPLIIAAVVVVGILVLALLVKSLWRVPAADQALIITGFRVKGRTTSDGSNLKIVTGGGAFVMPVLQKAQYLGVSADKALLEV